MREDGGEESQHESEFRRRRGRRSRRADRNAAAGDYRGRDGSRTTSRNADLEDRAAQVKRWGIFIIAALVFLPRELAVTAIVALGLLYMCYAIFA